MALEGVGPSIARGNQEEKGNCADLAAADIKIIIEMNTPIKLCDCSWVLTSSAFCNF